MLFFVHHVHWVHEHEPRETCSNVRDESAAAKLCEGVMTSVRRNDVVASLGSSVVTHHEAHITRPADEIDGRTFPFITVGKALNDERGFHRVEKPFSSRCIFVPSMALISEPFRRAKVSS